jgi:hypothetical protein
MQQMRECIEVSVGALLLRTACSCSPAVWRCGLAGADAVGVYLSWVFWLGPWLCPVEHRSTHGQNGECAILRCARRAGQVYQRDAKLVQIPVGELSLSLWEECAGGGIASVIRAGISIAL